jgi:hypothetical protein
MTSNELGLSTSVSIAPQLRVVGQILHSEPPRTIAMKRSLPFVVGLGAYVFCCLVASVEGQEKKTDPPRPKNPLMDIPFFSIGPKDTKDAVSGNPSKHFFFDFLEGNSYTIDIRAKTPKFDPLVRLEDEKGKEIAKDDNSGGGVDAHIAYKPAKTGKFKVVVTTSDASTGRFHITVDQIGNVGNAGSGAELVLKNGTATINSKLMVNDPKDKVQTNSPARSFPVKMKSGKTYVIDMIGKTKTGFGFDPYLRLEDPSGKEVAANDDGGGNFNARITYSCRKDGTYSIIATTVSNGAGFFDLKVVEK